MFDGWLILIGHLVVREGMCSNILHMAETFNDACHLFFYVKGCFFFVYQSLFFSIVPLAVMVTFVCCAFNITTRIYNNFLTCSLYFLVINVYNQGQHNLPSRTAPVDQLGGISVTLTEVTLGKDTII